MTAQEMAQPVRSLDRGGVALMAAVAALAIVALMISAIAWQILATRRVLEHRGHELQAEWLARAGVAYAAERLRDEASVPEIVVPELLSRSRVQVQVRADAEDPTVFHVTSEARYPTDTTRYVTRVANRRLRLNRQR